MIEYVNVEYEEIREFVKEDMLRFCCIILLWVFLFMSYQFYDVYLFVQDKKDW